MEDLLPCLGGLSVNSSVPAPDISEPVLAASGFGDIIGLLESIEGKRGRNWFLEDDGDDSGGDEPKKPKFDEEQHKLLLLDENREWMKYYPPATLLPDEQYDYFNWTRFYPSSKGSAVMKVKNPHWQNPMYTKPKHATLEEARTFFGEMFMSSVDLKKKSSEEKLETAQAVREFKEILRQDAGVKQYSGTPDEMKAGATQLSKSLVKLLDMLRMPTAEYKQPLWPRKTLENTDLPPGWISFKERRTPESAVKVFLTKGKMSTWKYGDNRFLGPHWETWDTTDDDGYCEVRSTDKIKDAWLIYLGYQKSDKTYDPNEKKTSKDKVRTKATKTKKSDAMQEDEEEQEGPPSGDVPSSSGAVEDPLSEEEEYVELVA